MNEVRHKERWQMSKEEFAASEAEFNTGIIAHNYAVLEAVWKRGKKFPGSDNGRLVTRKQFENAVAKHDGVWLSTLLKTDDAYFGVWDSPFDTHNAWIVYKRGGVDEARHWQVSAAARQGKPIPDEVLADFPDIREWINKQKQGDKHG